MTSIAPINSSVLTLFKTISGAGSTLTAGDRATQTAQKIAGLIATRITPAQKQAAATIAAAFVSETAVQSNLSPAQSNTSPAREEVSEGEAAILSARAGRAILPDPTQTPPSVGYVYSIGSLIAKKRSYDRVDQDLAIGHMLLDKHQSALAEATDVEARTKEQSRIDSIANYIAETESLAANFGKIVQRFDSYMHSIYTVTGNILTKNQDDNYEWGAFSVNNRFTGEMFFKHDGNGTVVELDGVTQPFIYHELN